MLQLAVLALSVVPGCVSRLSLLSLRVRGPQGQIVSQQLHDERGVLVRGGVRVVQIRYGCVKGLQRLHIKYLHSGCVVKPFDNNKNVEIRFVPLLRPCSPWQCRSESRSKRRTS